MLCVVCTCNPATRKWRQGDPYASPASQLHQLNEQVLGKSLCLNPPRAGSMGVEPSCQVWACCFRVHSLGWGCLSRGVTFSRNESIEGGVPRRGNSWREDFMHQCAAVTYLGLTSALSCGSSVTCLLLSCGLPKFLRLEQV